MGGERRHPLRVVSQVLRVALVTPLGLMARNHTVSGVNIGHLWDQRALLREELETLVALWRAGHIKPRVDTVLPFADAAGAHRRIAERQNIGKVILVS
jgi:NADPH:quinone reductase-like Zn-dependent oxidoreductase